MVHHCKKCPECGWIQVRGGKSCWPCPAGPAWPRPRSRPPKPAAKTASRPMTYAAAVAGAKSSAATRQTSATRRKAVINNDVEMIDDPIVDSSPEKPQMSQEEIRASKAKMHYAEINKLRKHVAHLEQMLEENPESATAEYWETDIDRYQLMIEEHKHAITNGKTLDDQLEVWTRLLSSATKREAAAVLAVEAAQEDLCEARLQIAKAEATIVGINKLIEERDREDLKDADAPVEASVVHAIFSSPAGLRATLRSQSPGMQQRAFMNMLSLLTDSMGLNSNAISMEQAMRHACVAATGEQDASTVAAAPAVPEPVATPTRTSAPATTSPFSPLVQAAQPAPAQQPWSQLPGFTPTSPPRARSLSSTLLVERVGGLPRMLPDIIGQAINGPVFKTAEEIRHPERRATPQQGSDGRSRSASPKPVLTQMDSPTQPHEDAACFRIDSTDDADGEEISRLPFRATPGGRAKFKDRDPVRTRACRA